MKKQKCQKIQGHNYSGDEEDRDDDDYNYNDNNSSTL